jgi:hypothetical protein
MIQQQFYEKGIDRMRNNQEEEKDDEEEIS